MHTAKKRESMYLDDVTT